jgi:hypothetical protein
MADTAKRLSGPTLLTTSAVTQYTVPALTTTIVRHIHAQNGSASAVTLTISIGADAAGTRIYDAISIPANGSLDWSGFMVLAAAETIQAKASAGTAIVLSMSGVETT